MFQIKQNSSQTKVPEQVLEDFPDYIEIIQKVHRQVQENSMDSIPLELQSTSSISSFFKAKNAYMIQYLVALNLYMLHRVGKGTDVPQSLLDRLLESRLMVSKMSTVQKKLQYQVDKIMQVASRTTATDVAQNDEADPMSFKPRPHLLQSQYKEGSSSQKYKAPKIAAALSKEDQVGEKMKKQEERRKSYLKSKLRQSLAQEEQGEMEGAPQEVTPAEYQKRYFGQEQDRHEKERDQYEEDNYVRLMVTKADKRKLKIREKQVRMDDHLDNLGEMHDINELLRMEGMADDRVGQSKTQTAPKRKGKALNARNAMRKKGK